MELFKIIISLIDIIIWPTIVLTNILLFRTQISNILTGNIKARYKDYEITIENLRKTHTEKDKLIEKVEKDIQQIENKELLKNIKKSFDIFKRITTEYEKNIISILELNNSKLSREKIIEQYFEYHDDPWNKGQFRHELEDIINGMIKKGLIILVDKNIELVK